MHDESLVDASAVMQRRSDAVMQLTMDAMTVTIIIQKPEVVWGGWCSLPSKPGTSKVVRVTDHQCLASVAVSEPP